MSKILKRCYHSHPVVDLGLDGQFYGGSCIEPAYRKANIYVALDRGYRVITYGFPWNNGDGFLFEVRNMCAPQGKNAIIQYRKMITWLLEGMAVGRDVHVGCIGGHGRTGMVLASLVAQALPEVKNAIKWTRDHYCKKAVESEPQVAFLVQEFGCKLAKPSYKAAINGNVDLWPEVQTVIPFTPRMGPKGYHGKHDPRGKD